MSNFVTIAFKRYPTTLWFSTGLFCFAWKKSLVATMYEREYADYEAERKQELIKA